LRLNLFLAQQQHGDTDDAWKIFNKIYKAFALVNHPDKEGGSKTTMVQGNQAWSERPTKPGQSFPDPRPLHKRNPPVRQYFPPNVFSPPMSSRQNAYKPGFYCRRAAGIIEREAAEWRELCKRKKKIEPQRQKRKKVFLTKQVSFFLSLCMFLSFYLTLCISLSLISAFRA
jgi:hypothetical protein